MQKCLARWVYPAGLLMIFSLLIFVLALFARQRLIGVIASLSILIWMSSIDPVAKILLGTLENQYPDIVSEGLEPLEYVVVLGGGTGLTTSDRPQIGDAGDRLVLGAGLINRKLAQNIVVTGDSLVKSESKYDSPREQSIYLLSGMGIAKESIQTLEGRNTFQEIQSLKAHPEYWENKRCGLITSAMHMPRAMQLAETAGVNVTAVPTHYVQPNGPLIPTSFIPSPDNLRNISLLVHEYLGNLVGR
jgi:uncharacterized SAM-binding protein YcdF (DUF218 family)